MPKLRRALPLLALLVAGCAATRQDVEVPAVPTTVVVIGDEEREVLRRLWVDEDARITATSRFSTAAVFDSVVFTILVRMRSDELQPGCQRFRLAEIIHPGSEVEIWRVSLCEKADVFYQFSGPADQPNIFDGKVVLK